MKVLYIGNLNLDSKGGLFKATVERIIRINRRIDSLYIINNNLYDSSIINFVKKIMGIKDIRYRKPRVSEYKNLEIKNANYKRTVFFYIKRVLHLKSTENGLIAYYLKHYKAEIENADLIHAHFGWVNGYIAYKISQKLNKPYVITLHGSDVNKVWKHNVSRLIEAMENAETCFFVSQQLLTQAKSMGYSGQNSMVTYNGVDTTLFSQQKKAMQSCVGFIGSLKKVKGADLLPNIFSKIKKNNPDTTFKVIGNGELKNELKSSFKRLDLNCEMPGFVDYDDMPEVLSTIDVLVVPSRNEGLGMIILEANAMGIPVVGTAVGGIPEAIGFKENIVSPGENMAESMADRVSALLNSETGSSRYRKRVLEKFDWDNIVSQEMGAYSKALTEN